MADYMALADIGQTLVDLLRDRMESLIERNSMALMSPGDVGAGDSSIRLTLFLYRVTENPDLKNTEVVQADPEKVKGRPMVLDLHYMMTSHPASSIEDRTERTKDEQMVLCRAMQVFHDHPALKGSVLRGNLSEDDPTPHLTQEPVDIEDQAKIWSTFADLPFRSSVFYVVTPVLVQSENEMGTVRVTTYRREKYMAGE